MSVAASFTIPGREAQEFKDKIQKEAARRGMSFSELVVEALAEYFRTSHD